MIQTFINAFESSPVHCLNPRPSGNCRNPVNEGTVAILRSNRRPLSKFLVKVTHLGLTVDLCRRESALLAFHRALQPHSP
jgi:hypothetical protein